MPAHVLRTPSYRHHKPTGQAVVTLNGRDIYLGRFGSSESRAEYDRLLAEWLVNGRRLPSPASPGGSDITVNELLVAYLAFADSYYVKHGKPTTEPASIRVTIRPLRKLYGNTPARDFGPLQLKAVRQTMVESGLCRNEVNKRTGRIVRAFKWAVGEAMVPPSLHHGLQAVSGPPTGPGRGPGEQTRQAGPGGVRGRHPTARLPASLGNGGTATPHRHAARGGLHHADGRPRHVGPELGLPTVGPQDRAPRPGSGGLLRPTSSSDPPSVAPDRPLGPLFSPREAMDEKSAERRRNRKSPVTPSQRSRKRKAKPERAPGGVYDTRSYYHAIRHGCRRADVPSWHPNQLRHNAATRLRKEFGLDVARAVLGHSSPAVTEVYAELDGAKASEAMERVG